MGKRKEEREYKGLVVRRASISAIAVVLSFEEMADIVARRKKRGFRDRGQQKKIEEETQCYNSKSRHKIWELLKRLFGDRHLLQPWRQRLLLPSTEYHFWNLGGGGNYFFFAAPLSISTLPCICTLCNTAHNTLHRRPPSPSFRRRDFHESQTFVFRVPHCVTGGARRDGDPPIPPSPPSFQAALQRSLTFLLRNMHSFPLSKTTKNYVTIFWAFSLLL